VIEEPLELSAALAHSAGEDGAVLIDCLTLWLANIIKAGRDADGETEALLSALARTAALVVIVSNEVGSGVIPANALARRYADALGTVNQRVAAAVGRVVLMAAGQPLIVKPSPTPEIAL
jgi:adenosylcobinamide kinase/adenosylcobinamide-phosphate guanylyltransferase